MHRKQSALKSINTFPPPTLSLIEGGLTNDTLQQSINTAWQFSYSTLWNNCVFSESEKENAKLFIREWLRGKDHKKTLIAFCQRIILARTNLELLNSDFLALPSLWLDQSNAEGYAVTKDWLQEIRLIRSSMPYYQKTIKLLAEGIIKFSETPTKETFLFYRNYLLEKQEPVLLNLFTVFCCNYQYNIQ